MSIITPETRYRREVPWPRRPVTVVKTSGSAAASILIARHLEPSVLDATAAALDAAMATPNNVVRLSAKS